MRRSPTLFALAACALISTVACAQNAGSGPARVPGNLNFTFDAQHDSVSASGMQIKPSVRSDAITPTTGTVTVTINISAVSHFPHGTQFHCSLTLIGGILDLNNGTVVGGIETANGVAGSSAPGAATCTLTIPYSWTIPPDPSAENGLVMAFGVAAVSEHDGGTVVHRSTLQLDGIESLPASGTTQSFTFGAVL
jgi:hypothetical protein